jgi:hypothetical protein
MVAVSGDDGALTPPRSGERGGFGPREALAVVEEEGHLVSRRVRVDVALILAGWGMAWLLGFGVAWLAASKTAGVPGWVVAGVVTVVNVVAVMLTFGQVIRRGRGIEGPSQSASYMYMWTWPLALAGVFATDVALMHQGLPERLAPLLWTGTSVATVGVLYLAGGMLYRDGLQYGLGVWMLITGVASVSVGTPANFAVLALAGGGGFLAASARYAWGGRRSPA